MSVIYRNKVYYIVVKKEKWIPIFRITQEDNNVSVLRSDRYRWRVPDGHPRLKGGWRREFSFDCPPSSQAPTRNPTQPLTINVEPEFRFNNRGRRTFRGASNTQRIPIDTRGYDCPDTIRNNAGNNFSVNQDDNSVSVVRTDSNRNSNPNGQPGVAGGWGRSFSFDCPPTE